MLNSCLCWPRLPVQSWEDALCSTRGYWFLHTTPQTTTPLITPKSSVSGLVCRNQYSSNFTDKTLPFKWCWSMVSQTFSWMVMKHLICVGGWKCGPLFGECVYPLIGWHFLRAFWSPFAGWLTIPFWFSSVQTIVIGTTCTNSTLST